MKAYMPAIRNGILMVLAHKTSAELLERSGKELLAAEIMRESVRPMGINIQADAPAAEPSTSADAADKPKVLIYDSGEEDLYTSGGNGAPNGIIDVAGGTNVFADVDNTWFKASWETVAKSEPDVIVIMDYKKSADEVQGKIDAIKSREGLRDLDAVKQNRFVVLPLAMFTSGFPNIYGAEQLRAKIEEFGLAPSSSIDWTTAPSA